MDDRDDAARAQLQSLCVSVAKFTRNLVAAVPQNQLNALSAKVSLTLLITQILTSNVLSYNNSENEPAIRELLRYYTSYYVMQDVESE